MSFSCMLHLQGSFSHNCAVQLSNSLLEAASTESSLMKPKPLLACTHTRSESQEERC